MAFSDKLSMLRTSHRLQQLELAKIIGVSKQTISNWENSNIQPSVDMIIRLAEYFGVPTDYLLDLNNKVFLEVTGIDGEQLAHLRQIAKDLGAQIVADES